MDLREKSKVDWKLIKEFFKWVNPRWGLVFLGGIIILFISLLQIPGPFLSQYLIDHVLPSANKELVLSIGGIVFGLLLLKSGISILNRYFLASFRERLLLTIKLNFFKHIISLPISYFKSIDAGYLLARLSNDTEETQGVFADNILAVLSNCITFIVGLGALFYIHWKLALISVLVLPFYFLCGAIFGQYIRNHSSLVQENAAQIGRLIGESFLGIFVIKIFAKERFTTGKLSKLLEKKKRDSLKMSILNSLNENFAFFVGSIGGLLVLCLGIIEIINGNLTMGKLIAFNAFLAYLYNPLSSLMGINAGLQSSLAAMARIFEILKYPSEFSPESKQLSAHRIKGFLSFNNVSFSYNRKTMILSNINLKVKEGQLIAVVGKSGAGKTSLVNLIPRFIEPTEGHINLDNIKISQLSKEKLRSIIGYVPQETFLFHGTIMDNIKFANPKASDIEIASVVKAAGLDRLLARLSLNLNTNVGVLGTKVSGGQKQLISIARALVKKPSILIFDEATAHLDYETEKLLKKAFDKLIQGKTTFIIAHRITTVLNADRIVVLEEGKVVGYGSHEQLYENNSFYKHVFDQQFSDIG
jgi:subfamily B ATP-binding cassette protein MsbA